MSTLTPFKTRFLICFLGAVTLVFFRSTLFAQDNNMPVIPFNTNFWNYWDHHWMMWLPEHPVYESIELSSYDNPQDPEYKLIRVFLTERAGNKQQYFYLNDQEAVNRSRANAFYRDIKYRTEGEYGRPLNLYVEFQDKDSRLIQWSVKFEADQRLRAGIKELTPSIHSVGWIFLFLYRDQTVDTPKGRFLINGVDYSFKGNPETTTKRYRSWYNHNVYSAVIVFGNSRFAYADDAITNSWGREFRRHPEHKNLYVSKPLGYQNRIEFETNVRGGIQTYRNISMGHTFRFDFEPSLPTMKTAQHNQRIRYTVSFDEFKDLLQGEMTVDKHADFLSLNWQHKSPDWAIDRAFQSKITFDSSGYELQVTEKK